MQSHKPQAPKTIKISEQYNVITMQYNSIKIIQTLDIAQWDDRAYSLCKSEHRQNIKMAKQTKMGNMFGKVN